MLMVGRNVYAIWSNPLFRDALQALLSHPDVHWIGDASDIDQAVVEILQHQPDTVLFEANQEVHPGQLIDRIEMQDFQLQIISLNIDTNEIILFRRDYRSVMDEKDLLQYILTPFEFGGIHDD